MTASRLLIVAPNWLGDAVMALPALGAVRHARPEAVLLVACRSHLAPLFSLVSGIDAVVNLGESSEGGAIERARAAAAIRAAQAGSAVLLPNSFAAAWMAWRAGVPERWGYRTSGRGCLLTRAVTRPRGRRHLSEYYLYLVRSLGLGADGPPLQMAISEHARQRADALLAAGGCSSTTDLVGLAPGAAYGTAKRWPPDRWAELIVQLADRARLTSVLVGSAADRSTGLEIERHLDRRRVERVDAATGQIRWVNLIGQTDLPTVVAVMGRCRTFVSNDSGAMHLAAASGLSVTAIIGPTIEEETAPLPPGRHTILTHSIWCRPCMLRDCPIHHGCMTGIEVERVWEAVVRMATGPESEHAQDRRGAGESGHEREAGPAA